MPTPESVLTHWPKPTEHLTHETLIRVLNTYKPAGLILVNVDGGGAAITAPDIIYFSMPDFKGRITGWSIVADQSGSIQFDLWRATYPTIPTVANTITAAAKPLLSAQQVNRATSVPTWLIEFTEGDIMAAKIESASTVTRVVLSISIAREGQADPV